MFIEKISLVYKPNELIISKDIIKLFPEYSKAYIFRLIKEAEANETLVKYTRGVYFLPKQTFFGKSTLTSDTVAHSKYIADKKSVYGIYSGLTLLNRFGLTSQVPNIVEIVTNNESTRKRTVEIKGVKFVVRKSRFKITNENFAYYTLLQLFTDISEKEKINEMTFKLIKEYMEEYKVKNDELIKYSMNFPGYTIKNMLKSGVLNRTI